MHYINSEEGIRIATLKTTDTQALIDLFKEFLHS